MTPIKALPWPPRRSGRLFLSRACARGAAWRLRRMAAVRACCRRHGLVKNRVCFKFAFGCAFSRAFLAAFAAARLRNAVVRIFESRGADCVLYLHPYYCTRLMQHFPAVGSGFREEKNSHFRYCFACDFEYCACSVVCSYCSFVVVRRRTR